MLFCGRWYEREGIGPPARLSRNQWNCLADIELWKQVDVWRDNDTAICQV